MSSPQKDPFWDHDCDQQGRSIRLDVRCAAQEVWEKARRMTEALLGDSAEAAEIFESCVARVSRYLDERQHGLFTQRTRALLFVAFRNALRTYAQKARRMQSCGDNVDELSVDLAWQREMDLRLDLAKLVRQLSVRSRVILNLRHAGYEWREVAALLGVTVPNAKSGFWREIRELQAKIGNTLSTPAGRSTSLLNRKFPRESAKSSSSDSATTDLSGSSSDVTLLCGSRSPPEQAFEYAAYKTTDVKRDQSGKIVGAKTSSFGFPDGWFNNHVLLLTGICGPAFSVFMSLFLFESCGS